MEIIFHPINIINLRNKNGVWRMRNYCALARFASLWIEMPLRDALATTITDHNDQCQLAIGQLIFNITVPLKCG
jgi:hypothetical protein